MSEAALRVEGVSKHFAGVRVLDDVALELAPGEVHGLLGANGSGKSTLIKILAGFHAPDPGARLWIRGNEISLPLPPGAFRGLGLAFVHQDLGLIPTLTATENLFIDEIASSRSLHVSWSAMRQRAASIFSEYGVAVDPTANVMELSQLQRALLAITRAVHLSGPDGPGSCAVLVLDEPTVFLPRRGIEQLFSLVRGIVGRGASVLFVSHDLAEVQEVTDRVTVLRDGRSQGTSATASLSERELIEMIIGRRFVAGDVAHTPRGDRAHVTLTAGPDGLVPISLACRRGEIVGLTGLAGSGFERIPYLAFGAQRAREGELVIGDERAALATLTPARARRMGAVLLPADRQHDGSVGELSVAENIMLPVLDRYTRGLRLRRREMIADAAGLLERFDVSPRRPDAPYATLSGGNQQKALLAKWLQLSPSLLLLDEPTQGVDVGAREQIFSIISSVADADATVICASSDYEQLARLCDRVLVFSRGRIVRELAGSEVTKQAIAEAAIGGEQAPVLAAGR